MSSNRRRTNPVDGAMARLADLAGRGVRPARMEREIEAIVAGWVSPDGTADVEVVLERLTALHESLLVGVTDAAEQHADVDRSDAAALRQAGLVYAALEGAVEAVVRARDAQQRAPAEIVAPVLPAGTIPPLTVRNAIRVDVEPAAEVRTGKTPIAVLPVPASPKADMKKRKPKSNKIVDAGLVDLLG